eukprot:3260851-Rhodomonas_salina.1
MTRDGITALKEAFAKVTSRLPLCTFAMWNPTLRCCRVRSPAGRSSAPRTCSWSRSCGECTRTASCTGRV